jgi:hypothetical protein
MHNWGDRLSASRLRVAGFLTSRNRTARVAGPTSDAVFEGNSIVSRIVPALSAVFGAGLIANGLFMLVSPADWYFAVPGVTTTGPFNQHFVRDIGLVFVLVGVGYALGAVQPINRLVLWSASSLWMSGHALFHFWEVAAGICGADALVRDFALVTLPAIVGVMMCAWAYWHRPQSPH